MLYISRKMSVNLTARNSAVSGASVGKTDTFAFKGLGVQRKTMPRLPIGHPNFAYRPWTDEQRAALRESHRRRLGNLPGHYRVYGVQVPEEHVTKIRYYGSLVANFRDYATAREFVEGAKDSNWDIEGVPYSAWGEREWQLYRDLIAEGMSREDVARFAKVTEWYLNKGVWQHRMGRKL